MLRSTKTPLLLTLALGMGAQPHPGGLGDCRRTVINVYDGRLKPIIAKTFSLDQIVEAHRYLESNQQIGKIVVTV